MRVAAVGIVDVVAVGVEKHKTSRHHGDDDCVVGNNTTDCRCRCHLFHAPRPNTRKRHHRMDCDRNLNDGNRAGTVVVVVVAGNDRNFARNVAVVVVAVVAVNDRNPAGTVVVAAVNDKAVVAVVENDRVVVAIDGVGKYMEFVPHHRLVVASWVFVINAEKTKMLAAPASCVDETEDPPPSDTMPRRCLLVE